MDPPEGSIEASGASATPERRRDLDLLRMFVVVGLVFFHSARIFDTGSFYVKNDPTSDLVTAALAFAALWGMPLLYVIAGMGIWYSLRRRSTTTFVWERVRRLLVPLVFGVLVIVPPQVWTRLRGDPAYDESYWRFLSRFYDVRFNLAEFPFVIGDDPADGLFEVGHLWFVVLLFAFSLVLLPLIWYLRRPAGLRLIERLAGDIDHLWVIAVAGFPFAALDAALGSEEGLAGWNRYSYAVFILYGYLLAADRRFGRAVRQHRKGALVLGFVTFIGGMALYVMQESGGGVPLSDYDLLSVGFRALKGVSGWLWVVAIIGLAAGSGKQEAVPTEGSRWGSALLDRVGEYTAEAVLPIYVLHQTVIVLLGFYVVEWPISATVKYLTISLISLAIILGVYDLAVRRTRPTRFLFGMKQPERERRVSANDAGTPSSTHGR